MRWHEWLRMRIARSIGNLGELSIVLFGYFGIFAATISEKIIISVIEMARLGSDCPPSSSAKAEKAFSFISKGWREVRNSADADLKLMRARASSFKVPLRDLANSFDKEWENLLNLSSTNRNNNTSMGIMRFKGNTTNSLHDLEIVKKLKPKLTELRRAYSSPELSRQYYDGILSKWGPSSSIDLSVVKKAFGTKMVDDEGFYLNNGLEEGRGRGKSLRRRVRFKESQGTRWKGDAEMEMPLKEWEPFRAFKDGLKDFEKRAASSKSASEFFENFKRHDFIENVKKSLFSKERRSIIAVGDTAQFIPDNEADIAVLEEPEHLNWYYHGKRWTDKFSHVIGVVHTNYLEYVKREKNGAIQAFFVKHVNNWVTRIYCDKVLRLSAATQELPKSIVCNVHGVCPKFLEVGKKVATDRELGKDPFSKGAYFLGKMVWGKGYRELVDLLAKHKDQLGGFKLDVYGNGEDSLEVQSAARRLELNMNFHQGRDHADDSLHSYKVFINPSVSDVLCTATAEALAMGKIVVCADHPSNEFFRSFPNCLTYKTSEDFVNKVKEALAAEPVPLSDEQQYLLSWEAATERFIDYADLYKVSNTREKAVGPSRMRRKSIQAASMPNLNDLVDNGLAFAHYCLTGNEALRVSTGAIPGTIHFDEQHSKDLNLLPPFVQNPVYGW